MLMGLRFECGKLTIKKTHEATSHDNENLNGCNVSVHIFLTTGKVLYSSAIFSHLFLQFSLELLEQQAALSC